MRKNEILKLRWDQVDFNLGQIEVTFSKNGEKRFIPMSLTLRDTLLTLPRHFKSPFVFCNSDGKPFCDLKRSFKTSLQQAEIEDFTFHDLRHTFASYFLMSGGDIKTLQEFLGHKSLRMTQRYSHLSQSHKVKAITRMDTYMDTKEVSEEVGVRK